MKVAVVSYSLSQQPATLEEWKAELVNEVNRFLQDGADIILYPELFLLGLSDYFPGTLPEQLTKISRYVYQEILPELSKALMGKDVLVCLGSGPRLVEGKLRNTAPVWIQGSWRFQDKLHLTPWETHFEAGTHLHRFNFRGFFLSTVICFDIEQLSLGMKLKDAGIDIVLVPSATADRNGSQRVNRCASARSVELGAAVITAPLIGKSKCELVDENEGRQGFFLPAQSAVKEIQEQYSAYSTDEKIVAWYSLDENLLREIKQKDTETKPYYKKENPKISLL